jgi:hypothetical protein
MATGDGTVKDYARAIMENPGEHYFSEIAMDIDGKKVTMESIITFIDDRACGRMYSPTRINPSDKDIISVALENGIDCRPPIKLSAKNKQMLHWAREEGVTTRGANIIRFARALLGE